MEEKKPKKSLVVRFSKKSSLFASLKNFATKCLIRETTSLRLFVTINIMSKMR